MSVTVHRLLHNGLGEVPDVINMGGLSVDAKTNRVSTCTAGCFCAELSNVDISKWDVSGAISMINVYTKT